MKHDEMVWGKMRYLIIPYSISHIFAIMSWFVKLTFKKVTNKFEDVYIYFTKIFLFNLNDVSLPIVFRPVESIIDNYDIRIPSPSIIIQYFHVVITHIHYIEEKLRCTLNSIVMQKWFCSNIGSLEKAR